MLEEKEYPRQNVRRKGIFISEQIFFHRFMRTVINMISIPSYKYIYFYANMCQNIV